MRLRDRVALVTGAGSGNGQAIARRFAAEGARLALVDLRPEGLAETVGLLGAAVEEPLLLSADVARSGDAQTMVAATVERWGRLDVLVSNAGITGSPEATVAHSTPDAEWERVIGVNLSGVFYGAKYALPYMMAQRYGRIVNLASVAGLVAFPGRCAYTASKGGVVLLTKSLAVDYAPHGITVNAICPGFIDTPMIRWRLDIPELRAAALAATPLGRVGVPEEVANAALYLASEEAAWVTGATLVMDGGYSAK